jgi:hypothetical protein
MRGDIPAADLNLPRLPARQPSRSNPNIGKIRRLSAATELYGDRPFPSLYERTLDEEDGAPPTGYGGETAMLRTQSLPAPLASLLPSEFLTTLKGVILGDVFRNLLGHLKHAP